MINQSPPIPGDQFLAIGPVRAFLKNFKLFHGAAIALLGWYLIVPPAQTFDSNMPDLSAPYSRWELQKLTGTAAECEKVRSIDLWVAHSAKFEQEEEMAALQQEKSWSAGRVRRFVDAEKCISTDDPRLKEQ